MFDNIDVMHTYMYALNFEKNIGRHLQMLVK